MAIRPEKEPINCGYLARDNSKIVEPLVCIGRSLTVSGQNNTRGAIPIILKADNHRVSEDNATAKAMGYRHDATQVDVAKYPGRAGEAGSEQFCHNCQLYKAGSEDGWGACAIFPGKQVNANGWCSAWVSA